MIATPIVPRQKYIDKYEEPRHHLTALLEAHIITLDLPTRILFPLADSGVKTVVDLLRLQRSGLRSIRNIGVTAAAKVEKILSRADLINIDQRQKEWA